MFDPIQKEGSDYEEDLMEVLQGVVSSIIEAESLIQQPRPAVPLGGSTKHLVTSAVPDLSTVLDPDPRPAVPDPATVPESASIDQALGDFAGFCYYFYPNREMYDGALDYLCSCFYQFTYGLLLLLLSAVMVADSNSCSVLASCATVQSASSSVIPHLAS
ncbi:hypothetical protein RHGRI_038549 [Rhododendron griersonianum]|uniref:Uncharacterized protein n=1 Tax=Rhododendron griersonianum TaxID=479676 RepID=A0AAV6HIX4_9ERIC|nr:hypothetical protein RHGRI_038549 [Rhododendron griersonianum]